MEPSPASDPRRPVATRPTGVGPADSPLPTTTPAGGRAVRPERLLSPDERVGPWWMETLVAVNLAWCQQVTDAGLAHLKDLRALESLELMGCKRVGNFGTVNFAKMRRLKSLNLR